MHAAAAEGRAECRVMDRDQRPQAAGLILREHELLMAVVIRVTEHFLTVNPALRGCRSHVAMRGILLPTTRIVGRFLKANHASAHSADDYGLMPRCAAFCIRGRQVEVAVLRAGTMQRRRGII